MAVAPDIVRVTASPDGTFRRVESLMVEAPHAEAFAGSPEVVGDSVRVSTSALKVDVSLRNGAVSFFDANGQRLLGEAPRRGMDPISVEGQPFHAIRQEFDSDPHEGFYGLGQFQNGQMNYNGEDIELAQHNIVKAVPFVVSTGHYGILWDNNSISRFGDPHPYGPLGDSLIVRDADGVEGGLTGQYFLGGHVVATVRESDPNYQSLPANQYATGASVRDVFPEPLRARAPERVIWAGSLEARDVGEQHFRLYASEYVKLWVDGHLVIDRWRQNWNPWYYNFSITMAPGERHTMRIEWTPNNGYFRLQHLDPTPDHDRSRLSLSSEVANEIDYYFVHGGTMDDVIAGYRDLTGPAVMLPRWAYGFWQSRQRYRTQEELVGALRGYRDRRIPIDNIVLDWFYWRENDWGSHQFDPARFPDPRGMVDAVHAMNAQIMISVWPKFYTNTEHYRELDAGGHIYRRNIEAGALDWVPPGHLSSFYDPYSPEARAIYWRQIQENLGVLGFDAWWLDASEPTIHNNLSVEDRKFRMGPTALGPGAAFYNSYALENARAVYEGERHGVDPNKRVFILTRSGFAGQQRYGAAIWSGDIEARWDDLREQISGGVNVSMAGLPNWTFDIGGFSVEPRFNSGNPAQTAEWREYYLRFFQFGAFAPLFRSHGELPYREIYNIAPAGSEVYNSLVYYDRLRYRLLPYIYTLAANTYHHGGTIMRGLVMDFQGDHTVWNINDQYLFGRAFLVSPVYNFRARTRRLYLPAGTDWYDFYTGAFLHGGQWINAAAPLSQMPLHVRAGSIVPMGPEVQYSSENPNGDLTVYVYTGADGSFDLYEDDGRTYDYERGAFSRIPFTHDDARGVLTIGARQGAYPGMPASRTVHVRWVGPGASAGFAFDALPDVSVIYNGSIVLLRRTALGAQ